MKQLRLSIYSAAICAMFVGCTKDVETKPAPMFEQNTQTIQFGAPKQESISSTRLAVSDDGAQGFEINWKEGDVITIYDKDLDSKVGDFICSDATNGLFDGTGLVDTENYIAVYPASTKTTLTERDADKSYNGAGMMTQEGRLPTHLESNARMRTGEFIYNESAASSVQFKHEMVYIAVKYIVKEDLEPSIVENRFSLRVGYVKSATGKVDSGDYTYQYMTATERPKDGLHTIYFMVHPDDLEYGDDESGLNYLFRYYNGSSHPNYYPVTQTISATYQPGYVYNLFVFDKSVYTLIYDEDDLHNFSTALAADTGIDAILMNDITMTKSWTMHNAGANGGYAGVFDGNGKSITNLTVTSKSGTTGTSADYVGMFNVVIGTVKNLSLVKPVVSGPNRVGAIAGRLQTAGSIINCSVIDGSVESTGTRVGGIVGESYGLIQECYNSATISSADDKNYIGGIAGIYQANSASSIHKIVACENKGNVTSKSSGATSGGDYTGGIVGAAEVNSNNPTAPIIIGCINRGIITGGNRYMGGIVGSIGSADNKMGEIKGCYNEGNVVSTRDQASRNGIVGNVAGSDIVNFTLTANYYLASTDSGTKNYGDGVVKANGVADVSIESMNTAISTYGYEYVNNSGNIELK